MPEARLARTGVPGDQPAAAELIPSPSQSAKPGDVPLALPGMEQEPQGENREQDAAGKEPVAGQVKMAQRIGEERDRPGWEEVQFHGNALPMRKPASRARMAATVATESKTRGLAPLRGCDRSTSSRAAESFRNVFAASESFAMSDRNCSNDGSSRRRSLVPMPLVKAEQFDQEQHGVILGQMVARPPFGDRFLELVIEIARFHCGQGAISLATKGPRPIRFRRRVSVARSGGVVGPAG